MSFSRSEAGRHFLANLAFTSAPIESYWGGPCALRRSVLRYPHWNIATEIARCRLLNLLDLLEGFAGRKKARVGLQSVREFAHGPVLVLFFGENDTQVIVCRR
jgi:hypothetical protein